MAAGSAVKDLCAEATCSVCLDFFRDPVILTECGHNFCRACLARSWRGLQRAEASCPLCRGRARGGSLRPNKQLANVVEIAKRLSLQEGNEKLLDRLPPNFHMPSLPVASRYLDLQIAESPYLSQKRFCNCLEKLEEERENILACKVDVEKESQDLLKQTTEEKEETVAKFRELHTVLEEQENRLLAQMEEVEEEVARKRDQHLAELSEALSSLDSHMQEMEENCQQPATELLQDARSTLLRYEEKEAFETPAAFPLSLKWRVWDCSDLNLFLEGIEKQLKDTLDSGLHSQKANVTLDPDTAHPRLILTKNRKRVRRGEEAKALPNNPERFDNYGAVLGREGFTGGRHFWEVLVESEGEWWVGVARKSVRRKGDITFSSEEEIWVVGKWGGLYGASIKDNYAPLTMSGELKRIRVCLNYEGGRVAFFDADRGALIHEFSGASFSGETLLPFFWLYGKTTLKLSS